MKCLVFIIACALLAGPLFAADNDLGTLKATMESAASQRSTGVTLTVLGGVFLGAGIASYIIGYIAFFGDIMNYYGLMTSSEATTYIIWLAASIGGMALGGVGLGVGIPFIIIGNIRYNRAERQMKQQSSGNNLSWEPFIGIDPLPFRIKAGITATF